MTLRFFVALGSAVGFLLIVFYLVKTALDWLEDRRARVLPLPPPIVHRHGGWSR